MPGILSPWRRRWEKAAIWPIRIRNFPRPGGINPLSTGKKPAPARPDAGACPAGATGRPTGRTPAPGAAGGAESPVSPKPGRKGSLGTAGAPPNRPAHLWRRTATLRLRRGLHNRLSRTGPVCPGASPYGGRTRRSLSPAVLSQWRGSPGPRSPSGRSSAPPAACLS